MLRLFPHSWGKPWLLGLAHERFLGWIGARDLENQEFLVMLTILRTKTWILAVLLLFMEQVIFIAISWISIKDIEHEWRLFVRLCICMNWQQKIVERIDLGFRKESWVIDPFQICRSWSSKWCPHSSSGKDLRCWFIVFAFRFLWALSGKQIRGS